MRFTITLTLGMVCCLGLCQASMAQGNRGSGSGAASSGISSSGGFGGSGTSSSGFGGIGQTSGGTSGAGGASTGTFGSRNLGGGLSARQSSFGGSNRGSNNVGQPGEIGATSGNERFTRQGRASGQFVGADGADTANMIGILAGSQNAALQGLSRSLNNLNPNQGKQEGNSRAKKTVRAIRTIEFEYKAPAVAVLNTQLSTRLMNTRAIVAQGNLSVAMDGRTAILTGTVANEHARDLAARLCLLEPGVSKVENRLTIPEVLPPLADPATSR